MIHTVRTDSGNPDFIELVKLLDADLAKRNGADHTFYAGFNKIDAIRHVILAYQLGAPVGCGAIKAFSNDAMEVKRMYTLPEKRGKGIASAILSALEQWAAELSYNKTVLETGRRQAEAIALYQKSGYRQIPNYGQYAGVENSLCFEKRLK
jgi:putative acetyltransferase